MLFAVFNAETVAQLFAKGIFAGAAYGLLGVGFALILGVSGRFHFAYGFTYTLTAYLIFTLKQRGLQLPFWLAVAIGILVVSILGVLIEKVVYQPLAKHAGANALLAIFVAALGLGIAGENLIRLFWGSSNQNLFGPEQVKWSIWKVNFLNFDVWQAGSGLVLVLLLTALLRFTPLGRAIKATRVNPELATIIGINANTIYLICFFIGTLLAGVAALWYALQFTTDPTIGARPVIFAFVVAFLAGTASAPLRVFLTGIIIGLIENLASIWLSVRWTQLAVFVLLVGYLTSKSMGAGGALTKLRVRKPAAVPAPSPTTTAKA